MSSRGFDPIDSRSGGPDRRSWRGGGGVNRSNPYPPRRMDDKPNNWRGGGGRAHRGGRDVRRDGPPPPGNFRGRSDGRGGYRGGGDQRMHRGQHQNRQQQQNRRENDRIDRTRICPLMLRVFIQNGSHHPSSSFSVRGEEPTEDSILIYTWMDASLRELAELIQVVNQDARQPNVNISFAFVYPDRNGDSTLKHVHTIPSFRDNTNRLANQFRMHRSQEDRKTLKDLKFETGDFLSVAILQEVEELESAPAEEKKAEVAADNEKKENKAEENEANSTTNETTTSTTTPPQPQTSDAAISSSATASEAVLPADGSIPALETA